jgi:hypothetical protein
MVIIQLCKYSKTSLFRDNLEQTLVQISKNLNSICATEVIGHKIDFTCLSRQYSFILKLTAYHKINVSQTAKM